MLDYLTLLSALASPKADTNNVVSVAIALEIYGADFGLDLPHRFAQYGAQLLHESGGFRYDREVWGPTPAQERYDIRTDLGNTPERDGDGYKYRGRTAMQLTGRDNYWQFYEWARKRGYNPPDFVADPDLINTDPWEGLVPIFYWDTRGLNKYADSGDNENITRRINGGLNGYAERLQYYTKLGLAILGYKNIIDFQVKAKTDNLYSGEIDGLDGPKTRAAIHQALVRLGKVPATIETKPAPVTENVPIAPKGAENTGVTRVVAGGGIVSMLVGFFADMPPEFKLALVGIAIVAIVVLVWKAELIAARVKGALKAFGLQV